MEENRIETPLSEMDSNVNTVGDISTEEANQAANEVESNSTTCTVSDEEANAKAQELMELLSDYAADPNVIRAYKTARRVGERRQVSKQENKKKKAKRRMAKKSKR